MIDMELLLRVLGEPRSLSLAKIAARLDCPKTTAWRACMELCHERRAWKNPDGKYRAASTTKLAIFGPLKSLKKNRSRIRSRAGTPKAAVPAWNDGLERETKRQ